MSSSHTESGSFVVVQTHPNERARGWKPSYLSRYTADGCRSFHHEKALKFRTRAQAERIARQMRKTWSNEAGWFLEVREVSSDETVRS